MPTIEEFDAYVQQLKSHDWFFDYSDDGRVYRAGKAAQDQLVAKSRTHVAYQKAFDAQSNREYNRITVEARDQAITAIRESLQSATV